MNWRELILAEINTAERRVVTPIIVLPKSSDRAAELTDTLLPRLSYPASQIIVPSAVWIVLTFDFDHQRHVTVHQKKVRDLLVPSLMGIFGPTIDTLSQQWLLSYVLRYSFGVVGPGHVSLGAPWYPGSEIEQAPGDVSARTIGVSRGQPVSCAPAAAETSSSANICRSLLGARSKRAETRLRRAVMIRRMPPYNNGV